MSSKNMGKFEKYKNMGKTLKILKNYEKLRKFTTKSKNQKIHDFHYQPPLINLSFTVKIHIQF